MMEELLNAFVDLREEDTLIKAREMVKKVGAVKVLDICKKAMEMVGEKFEDGEYFLSELIWAGDIFKQIMEFALPELQQRNDKKAGIMVLGTVQGDVHDIGKNIFKVMVEASGIEVFDIGIDLPPEKFVEAVEKYKPDLVAMSCLIASSLNAMKHTVDALKEAGLRDNVKIIIGGGRVSEPVMKYTGADAWADDAARGVRLSNELIGKKG